MPVRLAAQAQGTSKSAGIKVFGNHSFSLEGWPATAMRFMVGLLLLKHILFLLFIPSALATDGSCKS